MNRDALIRKLLLIAGFVCYGIAVFLIIWSFVCRVGIFEEKYRSYIIWLSNLEIKIASISNVWLLIFVILLMYFIKTMYPLYPISILCVATAMVFNVPRALLVNSLGIIILFSVRYLTGIWSGGGNLQKLIHKNRNVTNFVEGTDGRGSPWVLFLARIIPSMTLNNVSMLYGAMDFPFIRFLIISYCGFLPKLIFYIVIGRNVSNPFSPRFSIPLMIMFILTGTSLIGMRWVFDIYFRKKNAGSASGSDTADPVPG